MAASKPTSYFIFHRYHLSHLLPIKHLTRQSGLLPSRRNTLARIRLTKQFRFPY